MKEQELEKFFYTEGLLIRTVSLSALGNNFMNLDDSIEKAQKKQHGDPKYYGPKRRWSIAHPNISPQFFMMGKDATEATARHLAIMAIPSLIDWRRYLAISSKDACSNYRIDEDTKLLEHSTAERLYDSVLTQLKASTSSEQNQNSEVSTLGFDIKAFCGLLFYGTEDWWNQNIDNIKKQLKILKDNYQIKEVDVYTYNDDEETGPKTKLTYKEKIEL